MKTHNDRAAQASQCCKRSTRTGRLTALERGEDSGDLLEMDLPKLLTQNIPRGYHRGIIGGHAVVYDANGFVSRRRRIVLMIWLSRRVREAVTV